MGCAPTAPVQSRLDYNYNAKANPSRIDLNYSVFNGSEWSSGKVAWSTTGGAKLVDGTASRNGNVAPGTATSTANALVLPGYGDFTVTGTVRFTDGHNTVGHADTLYIHADASGVTVSHEAPVRESVPNAVPTPRGAFDPIDHSGDGNLPTPPGTEIENPDFGGGLTPMVTTTVTGSLVTMDPTGSFVGAYGGTVEVIRLSDSAVLASQVIDIGGNWSISVTTSGSTTCGLRLKAEDGVTAVHTYAGGSYQSSIFGSFVCNGGTVSSGNWNYNDANYNRAFYIQRELSRGWAYCNYTMGHYAFFVEALWQNGGTDGAYYTGYTDNKIHLKEVEWTSPDVCLHEFGHHVMDSMLNQDYPPSAGGSHWFTSHVSQALAWSEGFASYFMILVQGNSTYNDNNPGNFINFDLEDNWDGDTVANGNDNATSNSSGYDQEASVCAMLLDLADSNQDAYDNANFGQAPTTDIMINYLTSGHHCYNIVDWYNGWYGRSQGSYPNLNGQMMTHGMLQSTKQVFGVDSGVYKYGGTWYWGGYGSAWYYLRNFGSQTQNYTNAWVWLKGPANEDHSPSQLGNTPSSGAMTGGTSRLVYSNTDTVFGNWASSLTGTYTIYAGFYDGGGSWHLLEPGQPGATGSTTVSVVGDTTPPTTVTIDDGTCNDSLTDLPISVYAYDPDTAIRRYYYEVGTSAGTGNIRGWTIVEAPNVNTWNYTITGLSLAANTKYYVTVWAQNWAGYGTYAYGDGVLAMDTTPPTVTSVVDDGSVTTNATQLHFVANGSDNNGCLVAWWYWIRDDTTNATVRSWTRVATGNVTSWDYTATGLSLTNGHDYTIFVADENTHGQYGYGNSNGIHLGIPYTLSGRFAFPVRSGIHSLAGRQMWVGVGATNPAYTWDQVDEWHIVTLDASGNWSVPITYFGSKRVITGPLYGDFRYKWRNKMVTLANNAASNVGTFTMAAGDANWDNAVDASDYFILSDAYDTSVGDSSFNKACDFNEDDAIDASDYFILSDAYDTIGDF